MIITRMSLERRTFLRGIGATLALPLLDAMIPALTALTKTAANPIRRLAFVYIPNGAFMENWTPVGEGEGFALSPTLSPLASFREWLVIPSGLAHKQAMSLGDGAGDHSRGTVAWLSGVHAKRTEGADVRAGTTADQIAAQVLGEYTKLPSLELSLEPTDVMGNCDIGYSCAYLNNLSWRTPTTPLPAEANPRVVFERLFGEGDTVAQREGQVKQDRSILDSMIEEVARLQKRLGPADRGRVVEYLDSVRDVERRIQSTYDRGTQRDFPLVDRPIGIPDSFEQHAKLMFDLQALAFRADLTRVITLQMGREVSGRTYPEIGVREPHHALSHHQRKAEKLAALAAINTYHIQLFGYFLEQLRSSREGDGCVLDNSLILYGGALSDGNSHSHSPLPALLAGGAAGQLKGGRHIQYKNETPMTNLLLSMLEKVGVRTEALGDSTEFLSL